MKEWLLIPLLIGIVVLGNYIVGRFNLFVKDSQRKRAKSRQLFLHHIRIAAEDPELLEDIQSAIEICTETNPNMDVVVECELRKNILRKLGSGKLEIALLEEKEGEKIPFECRSIQIPHKPEHHMLDVGNLRKKSEEKRQTCVVWNAGIASKERDRVIYMIENVCQMR